MRVYTQTRDSIRSEAHMYQTSLQPTPSDSGLPAATTTACEKCIEVLKVHCSSFGARELLSSAAEFLESHATAVDSARILIFPECGCAFFEWSIILMMLKKSLQDPETQKPSQNSGNLQVALMDAYIPDHAPPVWGELAALLQLDLHIFTSYRTLNRWVRVHHAGCVIPKPALVVYCNGAMLFGRHYCAPDPPDVALQAAIDFWHWCEEHAANRPVNLGIVMFRHANTISWNQLADRTRRSITPQRCTSTFRSGLVQWWDRWGRSLYARLLGACHQ
jgi:hypothetical protein